MNQCWPEGALRAYLDGELSTQDVQSVAAHLRECAACERLHLELSARAGYVSGLIGMLDAPAAYRPTRPARSAVSWRWTGAAVALAAGLAIATVLIPKPEARKVVPAASVIERQPVLPEPPAALPAAEPPRVVAAARKARPPAPRFDHFLALDDEPIESGIVMRVTVPGSTPADIVFSPDGRARAIRLVDGASQHY